ncbi:MAG: lipoate--protein ligase, partial [Clostridia bacterium]
MMNLIIINTSLDPWYNLAFEEYLLDKVTDYRNILFLWQNSNTVVIGKNQNPWRECRSELLEAEGGKLARRSTGGGAVYHDMGNLNFSFIIERNSQDFNLQARIITQAVKKFGIEAYVNGRNDIVTNEGKFSGNAFTYRKNRALHHGTILVDVNREKLGRYLQVSKEKMEAKGIKSVQSRIVNLKEYNNTISIDDLRVSIVEAFIKEFGESKVLNQFNNENALDSFIDKSELDRIYGIYSSWEFRYAEAPRFDIEWTNRFTWGGIEIHLSLKNGIIEKSMIYSDALDEAFISDIQKCFNNVRFKKEDMADAVLKG